jgi:hypothetical protein
MGFLAVNVIAGSSLPRIAEAGSPLQRLAVRKIHRPPLRQFKYRSKCTRTSVPDQSQNPRESKNPRDMNVCWP